MIMSIVMSITLQFPGPQFHPVVGNFLEITFVLKQYKHVEEHEIRYECLGKMYFHSPLLFCLSGA